MNIKHLLSKRIGLDDIHLIISYISGDSERKQELYNLLYNENDKVAYQSAWVMTHFSLQENEWLNDKQNELIDEAMSCTHAGKRRLILTLLLKQTITNLIRIDFLDFCLEGITSRKESVGVQSLCIKLSYKICCTTPELLQELKTILDMMDGEPSPAIQVSRRNVLNDIYRNNKKLDK